MTINGIFWYVLDIITHGKEFMVFFFMSVIIVDPSSPNVAGFSEDWVATELPYNPVCTVEEAKPQVNVIWMINDVTENAVVEVTDVGTEGLKKTTATLVSYSFSRDPEKQKVSCIVTSWGDNTNILDRWDIYPDVYCKL